MFRFMPIVMVAFQLIYVLLIILGVSFTGLWTDIFFVLVFCTFSLWKLFNKKSGDYRLKKVLRAVMVIYSSLVFLFLGMKMILEPSSILNVRVFYFEEVEGRLFNAYAVDYGNSYSNLSVAESPRYFPIVESRIAYSRFFILCKNDEINRENIHSFIESRIFNRERKIKR